MSMGRQSLTRRAWKAQGCFACEVQSVGRKNKRQTKGANTRKLRAQAKKEIQQATTI